MVVPSNSPLTRSNPMKTIFDDVNIIEGTFEYPDNKHLKFAAFIYSGPRENPHEPLEAAIYAYVGDAAYHDFVPIPLDNPFLRVITSSLNIPPKESFSPGIHHINNLGPSIDPSKLHTIDPSFSELMNTHKKALKRIAELEHKLSKLKSILE